ncbi:MAG TPA: rhomboid family intramembrane serine protease [Thermoanaerobaculia bacterium]|nr:rhomboid family intramembrane serine protease [Thermoanaerobaculia bacterium]
MAFGQRTPATTVLLVAILLGFGLELLTGGVTGSLSEAGANYAPAVAGGQYWRLVTSMFLHGGILHLALNGWALYQLGGLFEIWLGSVRLLVVYFASGIAGSIASVLWTEGPSVGASGAIFGLLGALIAFLLRRHEALTPGAKSLLMQLVMWAVINVFFGFSTPGIDNAAHLGGCAAGLLLGLVLRERRRYRPVAEV